MKRIVIAFLLLTISCKDKKSSSEVKRKLACNGVYVSHSKESNEAEKWLRNTIENYFKTDLGKMDVAMQKITTKDYYQYKTDAINIDLDVDGSLTQKQFHEKWKNKFDTEYAGIGVGFLITAQDWNEIKVSMCELTFHNERYFMYNVILVDKGLHTGYGIRIKVVKKGETFLIADVMQETPQNLN